MPLSEQLDTLVGDDHWASLLLGVVSVLIAGLVFGLEWYYVGILGAVSYGASELAIYTYSQ
ncbi:hypothetical protein ACFQMA_11825 [Halosimplex aquaticum]|uniref:Uncharacterized protein n=1 Tax=Halosimplex aquaticum TaxID=3026162 RepID=A0ABD5Y7Y8_9EURY|nr:hypothetical protein [Halosimplex aquaticum]